MYIVIKLSKVGHNFKKQNTSIVKDNNFLEVCWFLAKNRYYFLSLSWKLYNPYCHTTYSAHSYRKEWMCLGDAFALETKIPYLKKFLFAKYRFKGTNSKILPLQFHIFCQIKFFTESWAKLVCHPCKEINRTLRCNRVP